MTAHERTDGSQRKAGGLASVTVGAGLALAASATGACASASTSTSGPGAGYSSTSGPVSVSSPVGSSASTPQGGTTASAATSTATATATASGSPTGGVAVPRITVQRSGGFAGLNDTVDLAPGGSWTASGKSGATTTGKLTTVQSDQIHTMAADPRITAEAAQKRPPTQCRDAFNYVLTIGTVRVVFVDCPADADQPAASLALVKQVLQSTIQATAH